MTLSILDIIVIILYLTLMLYIGWYYSKRNKTKEDYLLGGRSMNPTAVGISLFATLLSTLSYLSYPGEMIQHGPVIFLGFLAFPLIYYLAGWWLIPAIFKLKITSAYEILEIKLGSKVRMLATFMFLSLRLLWMATIIYVTVDIALLSIIPIDRVYIPIIGLVLMIITIIYTAMGGLKAVVLTDVIQSGVFVFGALFTLIAVSYYFGSVSSWLPSTWPDNWKDLKWGLDFNERNTLGNSVLAVFTWYMCTIGSDQMAVQRYISTKDIKAARKTLRISLYSNLLANALLALIGLALLAYFTKENGLLIEGVSLNQQADSLFPKFILIGLPIGITGVLIAGILSAAMSSISSGLNSVSSVIEEDILKKMRKNHPPTSVRNLQVLSVLVGVVVIVLSLFVGNVKGNLYDVIMKVVNLFVAPLAVLFFLALFVPFSKENSTIIAGLSAVAISILIAFFGIFGITVLWIMPISLTFGIVVGLVLSYIETKIIFFFNSNKY